MKEIKITHESAIKSGDLLLVETLPFFDVAGVQIVKVVATPLTVKTAGDMANLIKIAEKYMPKRFEGWTTNRYTYYNQFKFHYGFEIRNDTKRIKVITILGRDES